MFIAADYPKEPDPKVGRTKPNFAIPDYSKRILCIAMMKKRKELNRKNNYQPPPVFRTTSEKMHLF